MATRSLEILKAIGVRGGVVSGTVEDGGVVRMKILVKRQEMKQVLEQVMKKSRSDDNKLENNRIQRNNVRQLSRSLASKSLEPQLEEAKKIKDVKSDEGNKNCRSYWRPALQSIPEEL